MSFTGEIESSVSNHPLYWAGGFVAFLVVIYLYYSSGSKKQPATTNFTYSIGPSDAQTAAATQLSIAQAADQTAVSLANTQAATQTTLGGEYLSYLTTNSANALTQGLSNNATASGINASNNATSLGVTQLNDTTAQNISYNNNATQLNALGQSIAAQNLQGQINSLSYQSYMQGGTINSLTGDINSISSAINSPAANQAQTNATYGTSGSAWANAYASAIQAANKIISGVTG